MYQNKTETSSYPIDECINQQLCDFFLINKNLDTIRDQ